MTGMDLETAATAVSLARAWAMAGLAVAVAFLAIGLDRIDPAARGVWAFRPLLVPGLALLWPLVLWRWFVAECRPGRASPRPAPRSAHRIAWSLLAVLLPAILAVAILHRGPRPESPPVLRLDPPGAEPARP
jgi:hypothetical protein